MVAINLLGKNWSCRSPKGEEHMNEILDLILLVGVLSIGAIWITAVFCFIVMVIGGFDD